MASLEEFQLGFELRSMASVMAIKPAARRSHKIWIKRLAIGVGKKDDDLGMHTQLLRKFVVQLLGVNASIHDAAAALQTIERLADHNGWFGGTRESCEKLMKYPPKIPVNEEPRVTSPLESIDGEQQSILQRHCPPVKNIPSACKHPNSTNGNFGGFTSVGIST